MSAGHGVRERALLLPCQGERLLAVLAEPEGEPATDLGVVIIVGGPQYRAGSHRQFVHLARHLAAAGHPVLRFDVRGMGDSSGEQRGFEHIGTDIGAAIQQLQQRQPQVQRVVLWGLCDGASAALLYLHEHADPRVQGLCLLNPWVRSEASLARTHVKHYYRQRLLQRDFWLKLARGGVALDALRSLFHNIRAARGTAGGAVPQAFQTRMAGGWRTFSGPVLLVMSGDDHTAKEFGEYVALDRAWAGLVCRQSVQRVDIADADHTFSGAAGRATMERTVRLWLSELP